MTEFQTAALTIQEATLAVQETELEISRSAIRVDIGRTLASVLPTLVIAGRLLFMRSESRAREHARCHAETMAALTHSSMILGKRSLSSSAEISPATGIS